MAKHRYSEVKHPDKFAEALSHAWQKAEPYALPAGIVIAVLIVISIIWVIIARSGVARTDQPWEDRFRLASKFAQADAEDPRKQTEKFLEEMVSMAREHPGEPVAAVSLLEATLGHFRLASSAADDDPAAAKAHYEKAADTAEQFIADFPEHRHLHVACYEAGKARLELRQYPRALEHFREASNSPIPYHATLARFHMGLCNELLGNLDEARRIYRSLRDDPTAGWCAEQAEFQLAQLGRPTRENATKDTPGPRPATATTPGTSN